jgi:hypothetical protein
MTGLLLVTIQLGGFAGVVHLLAVLGDRFKVQDAT